MRKDSLKSGQNEACGRARAKGGPGRARAHGAQKEIKLLRAEQKKGRERKGCTVLLLMLLRERARLWAFDLRRSASAALYRHFILLRLIAAIKHNPGRARAPRERASEPLCPALHGRMHTHCTHTHACARASAKRYALSVCGGVGVAPSARRDRAVQYNANVCRRCVPYVAQKREREPFYFLHCPSAPNSFYHSLIIHSQKTRRLSDARCVYSLRGFV